MAVSSFSEGQSYDVRQLSLLEISSNGFSSIDDVTVVFTAGWMLVHKEGEEDFVVPRERLAEARGVRPSTAEAWVFGV